VLHGWVLEPTLCVQLIHQMVEGAVLGRRGKVEAVGRAEDPVSFLAKDPNHLYSRAAKAQALEKPCSCGLLPGGPADG